MNKVSLRCAKESSAKFLFASNRMFSELKFIRIGLYLLNIIPVAICFLPQSNETIQLACSLVSFGLTLINEVVSSFLSNYKEKAILEHQLYEAEITGSTFSKIEYDRESTNDLHETAIRKGMAKVRKTTKFPVSNVPDEINDDYSYLYLCRISAAKTRYILSRLFYFYAFLLIMIAILFVGTTFMDYTTGRTLYLLVCFWPLIIPFIKNCAASKKCIRQCVKICADIDNYFADGDTSVERLARFYYYVQNIEFEMLLVRPVIYKWFNLLCKRGINILTDGVTERFKDAIKELRSKSLMNKGLISQPKGKGLITKVDIDIDALEKKKINKKPTSSKKTEAKPDTKASTTSNTEANPNTKTSTKATSKASTTKGASTKPTAKATTPSTTKATKN